MFQTFYDSILFQELSNFSFYGKEYICLIFMFFYCVTGIHCGIEIIMKFEDLSIGLKMVNNVLHFMKVRSFNNSAQRLVLPIEISSIIY